ESTSNNSSPGGDAGADTSSSEADAGGGDGASTTLASVSLPQAIDGAMWANPGTYPSIPIRALVKGNADSVTISVAGTAIAATKGKTDGAWIADANIGTLAD